MHYQNHHYANQKYLIAITSVIYLSNEFLFYIGDSVDIDDVELVGSDWNISPNPAIEDITITLPRGIDLVSLSLFNSVGSKISDLPLAAGDQITVPVGNLQNGLYYINYQSKKETKSKSFVLH
tara:strand:+ start:3343 stop:3711 length:369 start_codon:yes stop_codon:yes gene_type:complete